MSYHNQYQAGQHELQPLNGPQQAMSINEFLGRVEVVRGEIRNLAADIQEISSLHQRALTSANSSGPIRQQLDQLVAATQQKNGALREEIRQLKLDAEATSGPNFTTKKRQVEGMTGDFKREVQKLLYEEQRYKALCRDQIGRQYRIANPNASEAEVSAAADQNWGDEGVFQSALRTNRQAQASQALDAVRARHTELQDIERSIGELARLFQDLETLVVEQEATTAYIEQQTESAQVDIQKGNEETKIAIKSGLSRRRLKQICFLVTLIIVLIIALALGLYFGCFAPGRKCF